ncbi:nuclear transport factor 2 family protein [Chryseobacterium sp. CH1]|uniref:nuclear transport factor 2 family protein n=1 Tax=Chryseobacterium sp. CH1 TaxID=713551 RepID=UPI00293924AC|nr:nuclear transport factor 2 family protein [Chryseobacterium sp. CH1]
MKKLIAVHTLILLLFGFTVASAQSNKTFEKEKSEISTMLDAFNVAAAKADYTGYFNFFADESTFIGTDATEIWNKKEFMVWAKPHFDKKKNLEFYSTKKKYLFQQRRKVSLV